MHIKENNVLITMNSCKCQKKSVTPSIQVNQDCLDDVIILFSVHRKNFVYGDISTIIYPASGSTADWAYDTADIPCAYAPELRDQGEYGFLIPENQIIPVAEEMYAGFITMADQVLAGRCDNK